MIHPNTQKVIEYPDTRGKRAALKYFDWEHLTVYQEAELADEIIKLAKIIDQEITKKPII